MSGLPYDLEPRGNTVQIDYEHRVHYLRRGLYRDEWNQPEVSATTCWIDPGSVGDGLACLFRL